MSLKHSVNFLFNHPLNKKQRIRAVLRFLEWQFQSAFSKTFIPKKFGATSRLLAKSGLTGATGNIYAGLHEFNEMGFLLHFLRSDDHFYDIGANIGSYTILAAKEIGAQVTTFEPIPSTFKILRKNIQLNEIADKVTAHNIGLGLKKGTLNFTSNFDTVNHVIDSTGNNILSVSVESFDEIENITDVCMIKMDVEGFETEVINGMPNALSNPLLKCIVIELNGSGKRYGYEEDAIHKKLISYSFKPYAYNPLKRNITLLDLPGNENTIYVRDMDFVSKRINSAPIIKVNGQKF